MLTWLAKAFAPRAADPAATAVQVMASWAALPVRETAPNRGPLVDAMALISGAKVSAEPWCVRAVLSAWTIAGWAHGVELDAGINRMGSVFYLLHQTHRLAPELTLLARDASPGLIRPGDALIRYTVARGHESVPVWQRKRSMTTGTHTEIVLRAHPDGYLDTIGGNTDAGDGTGGDGVYIHRRRYSLDQPRVVGFVRPRWTPLTEALS